MKLGLILAVLLAGMPHCARAQIIPGPSSTGNGSMTFQTGRYYTGNGIISVNTTGVATTGSLITGTPIFVPNAITLQTLSCETTGTVTGTAHARMVLYTDAGGTPGVPVTGTDTGDLTQSAAGILTSGTLGVSLSPGWYWPVWESSGLAGGTLEGVNSARPSVSVQLGSSTISNAIASVSRQLLETHTYGTALPSPWATSSESSAAVTPIIALGF